MRVFLYLSNKDHWEISLKSVEAVVRVAFGPGLSRHGMAEGLAACSRFGESKMDDGSSMGSQAGLVFPINLFAHLLQYCCGTRWALLDVVPPETAISCNYR